MTEPRVSFPFSGSLSVFLEWCRKFVQFFAAQCLETLLCGRWLEVIRVGLFRGVFEGLSVRWVERSIAH